MSMALILPSVFFSGFIFPRETMPAIFYGIGAMMPTTYFIDLMRAIILRGAGFAEFWPSENETATQRFVRRATVKKSFRTPWGTRITCAWSLVIGGCGWGYAPPNPEGLKKVRANPPHKPHLVPGASEAGASEGADGTEDAGQ